MPNEVLTIERLRSLLDYDPATGAFVWKAKSNKSSSVKVGSPAGTPARGSRRVLYVQIGIDRRYYRAHRLAWMYMTGNWPSVLLDHVDGNGLNNAWANLRSATTAENTRHQGIRSNNSTGFKGVIWQPRERRWRAVIGVDGKKIHLGCYATPEAAAQAYDEAAMKHHGEFAGLNGGASNAA